MISSKKLCYPLGILFLSLYLLGCNRSSEDAIICRKFVHKYGFPVSEKEWKERDEEGTVTTLLKNGVTVTQTFQGGALQGLSTYTYPYSSQIQKEEKYDQGNLLAVILFDKQGVPFREETWELEGKKTLTLWDKNGAPIAREEYEQGSLVEGIYYTPFHEIEGKVVVGNGIRTLRDREGHLFYQDQIEKGELVQRTTYHPNGKVHMVVHYQDYLPHGEKVEYTPNGNLYMISHWEQGQLHGEVVSYREGKKIQETFYTKGLKEGTEKRFDEEGNLLVQTSYLHGKKHGLSTFVEKNEWKSNWFFEDSPVSEDRFRSLESRHLRQEDFKQASIEP